MINSPGGEVIAGLAIYDTLRAVRCPIITVVQGFAASMGFLLMQAGDYRVAFPNSRLFYHEPLQEAVVNSSAELNSAADAYTWGMNTMNDIIRKRTKISKTNWNKYFAGKTSIYFTAEEAKALKLIDDIIEFPKKPKLILEGV